MFETKSGIIKPIVYVGLIKDEKILLIDYVTAPNPNKTGWWIPAPNLDFGGDPKETAEKIALELGFESARANLFGVESFVTPGGWHLICHYIVRVNSDPKPQANIKDFKWVTANELKQMTDIAHGKWEIEVGVNFLSK